MPNHRDRPTLASRSAECIGALAVALAGSCGPPSAADSASTSTPTSTAPDTESLSIPPSADGLTDSPSSMGPSSESSPPPPTSDDSATGTNTSPGDSTGPIEPPPLPPQKDAVFNYPRSVGSERFDEDDTVIASLLSLLDQACVPACDDDVQIRASLYLFTLDEVADAFIAAAARGADVEIIMDGRATNDAVAATLEAALGPAAVYRCGGPDDDDACIGATIKPSADAINHNKFALFSQLSDGSSGVVWQSSSNATTSQLSHANVALIVRDDLALYGHYTAYFDDLRAGAMGAPPDSNYYDTSGSSLAGDTGTRVYFFPRADVNVPDGPGYHVNAEDPILTLLGNLGCEPDDRVLVAMAWWKDDRIAIVDSLAALAAEGCEVEVLVRADGEHTDPVILDALLAAGLAGVFHVPHLHSKYVVADSLFKSEPRQLLWMGSHNFTYGALRQNDETLVRVDDPAIHAAFIGNFDALRDQDGSLLP